ncbi:MAG: DPP IV N-terminal domain-containing protein [Acidobacteria bacterium]|nr:DPP IV N-terminal domain-containing protein [Acidobacteriota bacterium]
MNKFRWFLIALFVCSSLAARAQDKMLSIDDIFDPQTRVPFSGRPLQILGWTRDGRAYKVFRNGEVVRVDAATGQTAPDFDTKKFVSVLSQTQGFTLDEANAIGLSPFQQFNQAETLVLINHNNDLWVYDIAAGKVKRLTNTMKDEELEPDFSPDGKWVSFVRGMNLYVVEVATAREKQLTRDGAEKILNGYLDWVYEEELYGRGNKRGYWWSPDSKYVAFLRTDESPVPKFVLTDDTVNDQRVENTDYPQAGDPNPLVTLGIADVTRTSLIPNVSKIPKLGEKLPPTLARFGDLVKFVDTSKYKPEDFLIVRVTWTPDSRAVMFQAQNREQTYLDVNLGFPNDGRLTTLMTERSKTWVEAIDNPVFLKDGSSIWQSERNGFRHLYRFDNNGRLVKQITDGRWEVSEFYGVDEARGYAYFSAIGENNDWIDTQIYRVRLDGTGLKRLTESSGTHFAIFDPTFTRFIDYWSDANTPTQIRLYTADGNPEKTLDENKVPVLDAYNLGKTQFLKVKTRDGFEMEAMMFLPPNFDPQKKYPVMAYTYSGPHAPSVRNRWGGAQGMWHRMLAQKGYIVWVCDNRTASGKGAESTWNVYQKFGQTEVPDLEDGFKYLKSLSFVDGSRIGMWGWSYGGFMTTYFMTHSNTLKMGIAGGMVGNWALYDSIYTERYMRTPQNNPDGYKKGSVIDNAANLSGKLLIIHGAIDNNVHQQNAIQFIYELQRAGKQFEFMTYPTQRHGVQRGTMQEKHLYTMMTGFIERNL